MSAPGRKSHFIGCQVEPITGKLANCLIRILELVWQRGEVTPDSTFFDLGVDSFDGMDLLLEFERVFQMPIPDDIASRVETVRDAVAALRHALETAPAA